MKIICLSTSVDNLSIPKEPCVMALGSFDGVHLGHRRVIGTARKMAEQHKLPLMVLTFYPHPREVLGEGVDYLMPMEQKEKEMADLGVDCLYVVKFDSNFAQLPSRQFVNQYMVQLHVKHAVVGFDFKYGCKGMGNVRTLEADGDGCFQLYVVPRMDQLGQKISSTLIRNCLRLGDVKRVVEYLGDYYITRGEACIINKIPYQKGVKAWVFVYPHYTLPAEGSYQVQVNKNLKCFNGIANVALKSTGERMLDIECHDAAFEGSEQTVLGIKWIERIHYQSAVYQ